MSEDPYNQIESEIRRDFSGESVVRRASPPDRVLFRIDDVPTPAGSIPSLVKVLLIYRTPAQPPEVLVNPLPSLTNGRTTPNDRPTQVEGEIWHDYSVKWSWEQGQGIWMNVRRKLMRFASNQ